MTITLEMIIYVYYMMVQSIRKCIKRITDCFRAFCLGLSYGGEDVQRPFYLATLCSLVGVVIIVIAHAFSSEIMVGIGQSIVAGYIFYFFVDFVPNVFDSYNNASNEAAMYRSLQLLLFNFDNLIIKPYEKVIGEKIDYNSITLDGFFNHDFLMKYLNGFDIECCLDDIKAQNIKGKEQDIQDEKNVTFIGYAYKTWEKVLSDIDEIQKMPYPSKTPNLNYLLRYLKSDSPMSIYWNMVSVIGKRCSYNCMIGLDNILLCERFLFNIIGLHEIAFDMYRTLSIDNRWTEIYPSPFHPSKDMD